MQNKFLQFAPKGTYAMVKYDTITQNNILKWAEENGIPKVLPGGQLHSTLILSQIVEIPDWKEMNAEVKDWRFKAKSFSVQSTRIATIADGAVGGLLLFLDAPELVEYHEELKRKGGKHNRRDYEPHITISYHVPLNLDLKTIKLPTFDFVAHKVVVEPVDLDWTSK